MKKAISLLLVLGICLVSSTLWAQQVIIKGKYNGKMLTVKAQRAPGGDIIESISYAPLDDLKKEVAGLKKQHDDLEKKLAEAKKKNGGRDNQALTDSLEAVTTRLQEKEEQVQSLQDTIETLAAQLKQSEQELSKTREELNKAKSDLSEAGGRRTTVDQKSDGDPIGITRNADLLGFEAFFGASFINNNLTKQDFWSRPISGAQKYHLTLTHYFSNSSPVALKVGLGLTSYKSQGSFLELSDSVMGMTDVDGDRSDTYYNYRNVSETIVLKYLDIPIQLHIGNSYEGNGIQAWMDAGITLGLNVTKSYDGKGTYSSEAYYPEWNVRIHDIPELGLVTDAGIYDADMTLKVNKLVVWANAAIGMYIPLGEKLGMNVGARIDYSLTPLATNEATDTRFVRGMPNLLAGEATRVFSAGANIGLTYKF